MLAAPAFSPLPWLRGRHLQSILPSFPGRRVFVERRSRPMRRAARELLLDAGDGVRLQGFHSPANGRSLAVLLHGWEGSAESLYILSLGQALYEQGYDVVRLNLRDHGDTHHLNRDLFHSCRLPEVVGAVRSLQTLLPSHDMSLVGFSLGGNFMLRVAAEAPQAGLRLRRVVAISPVLDPANSLAALDSGWALYRWYFVRKWIRSLRRKQQAWPGVFDFGDLLESRALAPMTRELVLRHTDYPDLESYFRGYAITGERLASLQIRSTIIMAEDDPIIPASDLVHLARPSTLKVIATPFGGHCGFFESLSSPGWIERLVLAELRA